MKKLFVPIVVAFVATLCLAVTPQSAGAQADPYVGDVPTNCRIKVDHKSGKRDAPRILVLVEVPNSRAHPKGRVKVVVRKKGGEVIFTRSYSSATGRTHKFFAPKAAKSDKYKAKVTFTPAGGSVFVGCERSNKFRYAS
jgi:hypothetical protein